MYYESLNWGAQVCIHGVQTWSYKFQIFRNDRKTEYFLHFMLESSRIQKISLFWIQRGLNCDFKNFKKFQKKNFSLHTGKKREFPGKNHLFPVFPVFPEVQKVREIVNLKPGSQNPGNVDGKFKTLRIGWFLRIQRFWTWKICGIFWVILENLWNQNSVCHLT